MDNTLTIILIGTLVVILLVMIPIYNNLVTLKNNVLKAFANIDVLAKQRHDEIPKLVDACKEYMGYEQETLSQVMTARGSVITALEKHDVNQYGKAETRLRSSLGGLFALAENYPDLKANNSFIQLQSRISDLENTISDRRESYNENVTLNNIRIKQFPDMFVAVLFRFNKFELLEFNKDEISDIDIDHLFKK